ncbi:threonylcarbamoyl-AMP synthase [bacterium]|nr:threonylcarbamoyl-AMP synthase [bacterium]
METKVLRVNGEEPEPHRIEEAAQVIRDGGLVIFPTDTLYGLGVSAFNQPAVERMFQVKRRVKEKAVSVLVANFVEAEFLIEEVSPPALNLMSHFWPGPLTLLFKANDKVPAMLTANSGKIGIRIPDNKVALALIKASGTPLTGSSANLSGKPDPLGVEEVERELSGQVDLIIDGGRPKLGKPSTVFDITSLKVLREGSIGMERIEEVLGCKIG